MNRASTRWDRYGLSRSPSLQRTIQPHHRLAQEKILSILKKIDRQARVLDIGCGDGFFLDLLGRLGFQDFRGIDPGRSMVERCRARNLPAEIDSLADLERGEGYDLVLLFEVLEHLEDPVVSLAKIYSLLQPSGKLLLSVPVCDSFLKRYHRFRYGTGKKEQVVNWDETHLHAFSASVIRNVLKATGFRIQKSFHASNPFPWVGRYGGKKLAEFFQRFSLCGRFGDILVVLAVTESDQRLESTPRNLL